MHKKQLKQVQNHTGQLSEIRKIKTLLKEEHEYFSKQISLMANMLSQMQTKCQHFYNKYD